MKTSLLLGLMVIALAACKDETPQTLKTERLSIEAEQGPRDFNVELAITPAQMQKGLMFREEMADDTGMIFLFGDEAERGFYMKNTLISLDLIFIRKDGTILSIHDNAKPLDETTIYSQGPVAAVLEINGGLAQKLGIQPGMRVHHRFFSNQLAPRRIIE